MNDPLRSISNPALRGLQRPTVTASPADPVEPKGSAPAGGESFARSLMNQIDEVNRLQNQGAQAGEDLATGRRTDLEGVLAETQKADAAFRMLLALRNKVQAAYDEVKQVRI